MNIELDEVVLQDITDEALERAASGAQGGVTVGGPNWCNFDVALVSGGPTANLDGVFSIHYLLD